MKISYNWLKQFIRLEWNTEQVAELLTDLGLEVEGIIKYESIKGGVKDVVVGHVISCKKHPNADKLKVTRIDIGNDQIVQIVCGASNIKKNQKVPVATVGTVLYDHEGNPWEIKKAKIRGEASYGMVCAEDELGLGESHDGIMVLDENLIPGTPCSAIFDIELDTVFEIGLTPNRADAMSHYGVARDLRAGLIQRDLQLELITPSVSNFRIDNRTLRIDVDIEDKELCPRYCGVTISGIKVKESPIWLKNRLKSIGLTPKNNVVDVTNYVLHELGQPLHAFDASKITGNKIVVKTASKDDKFITLDGIEHTLHEEDLMICDAEKSICIAGVFGGLGSGVTENTTTIFLESAYFDPISIRKTAKRHGLNTDASFRFERGIDINNVEYALQRAALLIQEVAGGEITSDVIDVFPKKMEDYQVFLSFDKINALVGQKIPTDTVKSILTSLEIKINNITETGIGLTIPSYRVDVQREADVIEEIMRVYGYNNIRSSEKLSASIVNSSKYEDHKIQAIIANQLVAQGFYEIMTNSLTSPSYSDLSNEIKEENAVSILNPLSNDLAIMRQSMLFSTLEVIAFNINRRRNDLKIFEFGKTYHQYGNENVENKSLSMAITGNRYKDSWSTGQKTTDFFYLKSFVQRITERLGFPNLKSKPITNDFLSEGIALYHKKSKIVEFGIIKTSILKYFDIKQEVLYADFNWQNTLEAVKKDTIQFIEIPKFPEVKRDFALLIDESISFEDIYNVAMQSETKLLKEVSLFDVYQGEKLPKGKKSYAISFILQDDSKTLTDKRIDGVMNKLQQHFEKEFSAELR
ncbi:phenylalanine--tRNA ligase subunit beta [Leptobacterium sp. I13]|uniref:phenylalanine--tRNA ligase subunit beta n=1 Tax=Leptobacterium meishanense TaxID=3128904 RepID=UPI0030EEBE6D